MYVRNAPLVDLDRQLCSSFLSFLSQLVEGVKRRCQVDSGFTLGMCVNVVYIVKYHKTDGRVQRNTLTYIYTYIQKNIQGVVWLG